MKKFLHIFHQLADVGGDADDGDQEADEDQEVDDEQQFSGEPTTNTMRYEVEMLSESSSPAYRQHVINIGRNEVVVTGEEDSDNEDYISEDSEDYEEDDDEIDHLCAQYKLLERIEHEPCDIYLCGLPACGKSTLGVALQRKLQCRLIGKPHLSSVFFGNDADDDSKESQNKTENFLSLAKKDPGTYWAYYHVNNMCQKVRAYTGFGVPHHRSRFNVIESCVHEDLYAWVPFTRTMGYLNDIQHWTIVQSVAPTIMDQVENTRVFRPSKIFVFLNVSSSECARRYDTRHTHFSKDETVHQETEIQKHLQKRFSQKSTERHAPTSKTASHDAVSLDSKEESDYYDHLQPKLKQQELRELQKSYHAMFAGSTNTFSNRNTVISVNFNEDLGDLYGDERASEKLDVIIEQICTQVYSTIDERRRRMIRTYKLEALLFRLGRTSEIDMHNQTSFDFHKLQQGDLELHTRKDGSRVIVRRKLDEVYDMMGHIITDVSEGDEEEELEDGYFEEVETHPTEATAANLTVVEDESYLYTPDGSIETSKSKKQE